eukprot:1077882-Alexandrium_andersonii.AAC.1
MNSPADVSGKRNPRMQHDSHWLRVRTGRSVQSKRVWHGQPSNHLKAQRANSYNTSNTNNFPHQKGSFNASSIKSTFTKADDRMPAK